MNRTHYEHGFYALLMQIAVALLTGDWLAGAAFGAAFFLGREHAQAEERYIAADGGKRYATSESPSFAAFNPKYWNLDSVLDFVVPIVAVGSMLYVVNVGFSWL